MYASPLSFPDPSAPLHFGAMDDRESSVALALPVPEVHAPASYRVSDYIHGILASVEGFLRTQIWQMVCGPKFGTRPRLAWRMSVAHDAHGIISHTASEFGGARSDRVSPYNGSDRGRRASSSLEKSAIHRLGGNVFVNRVVHAAQHAACDSENSFASVSTRESIVQPAAIHASGPHSCDSRAQRRVFSA
jgi:hypothetical protein